MTVKHTAGCDWHLDQYDHECTCGAFLKNKLARLEELASPAAMVLPEGQHLLEFHQVVNAKGFLEGLHKALRKTFPTILPYHLRAQERDDLVGKWLSAALDDPKVCDEMKTDIRKWMGDH